MLAIGAWVLLALSMVFVMSLGTDEAWVLNGLRSTLQPPIPGLSTNLIATSGGLFALVNVLLEMAGGSRVWLHRLPSLLFLALSVLIIVRAARRPGDGVRASALLAVPMLVLPGAAEVGMSALGTSAGLALMVGAMVAWTDPSRSVLWRVIVTGLLFGVAAATRFDLVLFGGAILLCGTLRFSGRDGFMLRLDAPAWCAVALGLAVFLLNIGLMRVLPNVIAQEGLANATGLSAWELNYPKLLNQWATLGSFMPVSVLALLSSVLFLLPDGRSAERVSREGIPRLESLLLASGIVLLAGWLLRAPIPHLRYLWPALFCFGALGSIGLGRLIRWFRTEGRAGALLWCQCMGVVLVTASLVSGLRSLVVADNDIVSWEWSNESPHDYYRRFEARAHQQQTARYLREGLPVQATIYSHIPYAMRYLAARPIIDLESLPADSEGMQRTNRYLLLGPMVGAYLYLDAPAWNWIDANAQLVNQFGRYSLYRLPDGSDAELKILRLARTNFLGHPGAQPWFGRDSLKPGLNQ